MTSFFAIVATILLLPQWVSGSAVLVKIAIRLAQQSKFAAVQRLLVARGWLIFPSFRYNEIIQLLRELSLNPDQKPSFESPEFSRYIVNDGMGYILTWDGKEKMVEWVNAGWFNGKLYEEPKYIQTLLYAGAVLGALAAVLRGIGLFVGH